MDDENLVESLDELGVIGIFVLFLIAVVFLPSILFLWYFSDKPESETSSIAALGGVLNVLFLVVVTVLFMFRRPLTGGVYLIWEVSFVTVLLGIGRSMFVADEESEETAGTETEEAEATGWRGWLWDEDRLWTQRTSRRRVGNDEGARVGRQAASDGSGRRQPGGTTVGGGSTYHEANESAGESERSGTSDNERRNRGQEREQERQKRGRNRAWNGDPLSFDVDPLTRTVRAAEVLDVDPNASRETVEAAYRDRVKEAHPDAGGSTEEFIAVKNAYQVLTGEGRRD